MRNYPKPIEDHLINEWIPRTKEMYEEEGMFYAEDIIKEAVWNVVGPISLSNFLDSGEVRIGFETDEEGIRFIQHLFAEGTIISLKRRGLIDSMEDEKGEEWVFLTQKGKDATEDLKKQGLI